MPPNRSTPLLPPRLLTYREAAALLRLPLGTLYAWVHEERIPHIRLSARTVRFDPDVLRAWLAERRIGE